MGRGGGRPAVHRAGPRRPRPGRGRQRVHRLRVLVGTPDTRARPPGGRRGRQGGGGERDELRCPDRDGERARGPRAGSPALPRPGQVRQLRHGGRDERAAAGEGLHGSKQDREVRGGLPRAYGRPAGRGRLRRHVARRAGQRGRDGLLRQGHADGPLQQASRPISTATRGRSPASSSSRSRETWGWCRLSPGSWRACGSR